ncbi:hypothetical protein EON66_03830 [archaeon]|nr:MAG: hypothetical protein EON66_03830 [archaeon]
MLSHVCSGVACLGIVSQIVSSRRDGAPPAVRHAVWVAAFVSAISCVWSVLAAADLRVSSGAAVALSGATRMTLVFSLFAAFGGGLRSVAAVFVSSSVLMFTAVGYCIGWSSDSVLIQSDLLRSTRETCTQSGSPWLIFVIALLWLMVLVVSVWISLRNMAVTQPRSLWKHCQIIRATQLYVVRRPRVTLPTSRKRALCTLLAVKCVRLLLCLFACSVALALKVLASAPMDLSRESFEALTNIVDFVWFALVPLAIAHLATLYCEDASRSALPPHTAVLPQGRHVVQYVSCLADTCTHRVTRERPHARNRVHTR